MAFIYREKKVWIDVETFSLRSRKKKIIEKVRTFFFLGQGGQGVCLIPIPLGASSRGQRSLYDEMGKPHTSQAEYANSFLLSLGDLPDPPKGK